MIRSVTIAISILHAEMLQALTVSKSDMPKELQKARNNNLSNIPGIICFSHDFLIVTKGSLSDHNLIKNKVFERLYKMGCVVKLSKCDFSLKKIHWLGFDIDHLDYRPKHSKVQAILELKPLRTLKEFRSFMGVLNLLRRFLPNLQIYTEHFRPFLTSSNAEKFFGTRANKALSKLR